MNSKNNRFYYVLFALAVFFFSFQKEQDISLREKIEQNCLLYNTDPEKAYRDSKLLLDQAIREKDIEGELSLYAYHCWYFGRKFEVENLINAARILKMKATRHKNLQYEATAHVFLIQAYIENKLYDKAIAEYDKALSILEKADNNDPKVLITRGNAHTYIANLYKYTNNHEKAIEKLKLVLEEDLKIEDKPKRNIVLHNNYANLADVYLEVNMDSSEHYLQKSMALTPADVTDSFIICRNHQVYGDIFRKRGDFEQALINYHLTEKSDYSYPGNMENLYKGFIEIYEKTGDTQSLQVYQQKLKDVQLSISNKKYDSMHQILEEQEGTSKSTSSAIIAFIIIVATVSGASLFYFYKRNRAYYNRLKQTEKKLKEYITRNKETDSGEEKQVLDKQIYEELADIAINNNQMFMAAFNNIFPDFSDKLLKTNPTLAQTEVEFSAYLKLNFSSKEIAQIKSIQPRSVQNKKHRLRKRLNIPQNIDIYHWFNQEFV